MKKQFLISVLISCQIILAQAQSNEIGSGISLKFTTNQYVDLGNVFDDLDFPFTFETWINPSLLPVSRSGIFTTDNDFTDYAGWYVRLTSAGKIEIEFGNGFGSGFQYRRGFVTSSSILLNKWTHVAIVCNSITNIDIYFNGINQSIVPTDGISSSTDIFHSPAPASIGKYSNVFASQYMDGQLDEIRLWNIARGENKIRNFMCQKADPSEPNLIAYWKADESYVSNTVNDYTVPAENGTIIGSVLKINSGAPIGDKSNLEYTSDWSGKKIVVNTSTGDEFMVKNISGTPAGVHVYYVNSAPYSTTGLGDNPGYYFGAFCATVSSPASYKVRYSYSPSNGLIDFENEDQAALGGRSDNSINSWSNINAKLDTIDNTLARFNQASRGEYILNIAAPEKLIQSPTVAVSQFSNSEISAFPNPSDNLVSFSIQPKLSGDLTFNIMSISGQLIKTIHQKNAGNLLTVDVSDLSSGIYLVKVITTDKIICGKFEVQK
ncbi:MAG TPA: T9SS type A sorting domain-containing protein [Chitinophagales bacterium]|nr:T9SS type A sorting domain-containing protein [Chitinophagales bacterium]